MFNNNCSNFYNVFVKSVFRPRAFLASVSTSCLIDIETKGGFPLLRNFIKIEATYENRW